MNVLIVDDEPIVRLGLQSLVNWEAHGFSLVGEAKDGLEAWQIIQEKNVDLLVTDILMPRMDGIELIRRLKEAHADIGILVLSCMDDFQYVKEAMRLGAKDYIHKPSMEPEDLLRILQRIKEELLHTRADRKRRFELEAQMTPSRQRRLSLWIKRFADSGEGAEALYRELFTDRKKYCSLLVYAPAELRQSAEVEVDGTEWTSFAISEYADIILLPEIANLSEKQRHDQRYAAALLWEQRLSKRCQPIDSIRAPYTIGIGIGVADLDELRNAISHHERQIHHQFYYGGEHLVTSGYEHAGGHSSLPIDTRNSLLRAVNSRNGEAIAERTRELVEQLFILQPSPDKAFAFIQELLVLTSASAQAEGYAHAVNFEQRVISLQQIRSMLSAKALGDWLIETMKDLQTSGWGPESDTRGRNPFVHKAVEFMKSNYHRNIGTMDIAEHVRLSRSYLSDLYSKETGESLSESLQRIRIIEAKERLRSGRMKVYEVAEAVGFADGKSFAKAFRRIVGCSPKEFTDVERMDTFF